MYFDKWLICIMDSLYDGILITDKDSVVKYVNSSYSRITGVEYDDIVGEKLREVRPGARLPDVISSGHKLLRVPRKEKGSKYVVNMSAIKKNGDVIGGISVVRDLTDVHKLQEELKYSNKVLNKYKNHVKDMYQAKYHFANIICEDDLSQDTKNMAKKFSISASTILIKGESGTGKELYAQAIHNNSPRSTEPFIAVNCATLNTRLLESELFGYKGGAFTGAKKTGKLGMFEVANGGTIFLDEITEMACDLQAKLLRTLQENTIRRVGGVKEIPIDVRIIAATNKDIEMLIENNLFRDDLFYRLNVLPLDIPPLRERKNDIKKLLEYYLEQLQRKFKKNINISKNVYRAFNAYDWPGNVRELINALEFAASIMEGDKICLSHLPQKIQRKYQIESEKSNKRKIRSLEMIIDEVVMREINIALNEFGDSVEGKKKAAQALGISLATLYNKLKE
ncbi:MAG: PAS domain S-box protein [Firmicutes bacterium]|nr:PAS domain S-box protein [Bacillota bacterium]